MCIYLEPTQENPALGLGREEVSKIMDDHIQNWLSHSRDQPDNATVLLSKRTLQPKEYEPNA